MADQVFKNPLDLAQNLGALIPENRKNTLNKRINYKGNNELRVTGGSHALDNQAEIWDRNNIANTMTIADPNGIGADWTLPHINKNIAGLNNRYENRNDKNIQYNAKTKRDRRLSDIYFLRGANRVAKDPRDLFDDDEDEQLVEQIHKYEGRDK